ncbi:MAG: OmpA family protein [Bacteroidota bacterium]
MLKANYLKCGNWKYEIERGTGCSLSEKQESGACDYKNLMREQKLPFVAIRKDDSNQMNKALYLLIALSFVVVRLRAQVTEAEVYRYLETSLVGEGDKCVLDYDFIYPCFGPPKGTTLEADVARNAIVKFIQAHPSWQFEISHHTDCRGSEQFNFDLSERVAQVFRSGLLTRGVSERQLVSRGYGESQPINNCNCDAACDDDTYEENRRYELKVLSD